MIKWGKCVEYNKPVVKELPDTISPPLSLPTSGLFVTVQVHTPGTRKKKFIVYLFHRLQYNFSFVLSLYNLVCVILHHFGMETQFLFNFFIFCGIVSSSFFPFFYYIYLLCFILESFLSLSPNWVLFFYYFVFQPVKKKLFGSSSSSSVLFICLVSFYFYYVVCVCVCVCILLRFLCVSIRNGSIRLIEGNGRSWSPSWTLRER